MKKYSLKLNFILNSIRLVSGAFFTLLTIPYITRKIGPENLGQVDLCISIISYFILFTALGIPSYGVSEIGKVKDNIYERSKIFLELAILIIFTTFLGYFILIFIYNNFYITEKLKKLLSIMGIWILFNNIGFEWFYQGIENQIYITVRFLVIRLIVIILMFLFVKNSNDYIIYGIIIVLMNSGSNILNFINIKKYISFKNIKLNDLNLLKHLKPVILIFIASLSIGIYVHFATLILGEVNGKNIAYYTVPNKLIRLILVLITSFGTVITPRISNCIKNNDENNYIKYINISLKYILLISIPSVVGIFLLADKIIVFIAGKDFIPAIQTTKILSFSIFLEGMIYFLGYQILCLNGEEKKYTISSIITIILNIIINYILIKKYYQIGAALGIIFTETIHVYILLLFSKQYLKKIRFYKTKNLKYFIAAICMSIGILGIRLLNFNGIHLLIISILSGCIIYFIILLILKEEFIIICFNTIKKRIRCISKN